MAKPDSWPSELIARLTSTDPGAASTVGWPDEFDYLVVDRVGCVAMFSTGGTGPIPRRDENWVRTTLAALEVAERLPELGQAEHCFEPNRGWPQCDLLGARGLFVYDWDTYNGPFQAIARPTVPVYVSALPAEIRDVAIELPTAEFGTGSDIGSAGLALPGFVDQVRRIWGTTHVH